MFRYLFPDIFFPIMLQLIYVPLGIGLFNANMKAKYAIKSL